MALELIEKIKIWLADYRSHGFTDAVNTAKQIAMEIEIELNFQNPTVKIKSKKKRMFDYEARDETIDDPEQKQRINFFYIVVDYSQEGLKSRFNKLEEHVSKFSFLYNFKQSDIAEK